MTTTKLKPVNESIVSETNGEHGTLYVFEPGNATRYVVLFQPIERSISREMDYGLKATLVTVINFRRYYSMVVSGHMGYLCVGYLMEKTGLQEGDAAALLALIRHKLCSGVYPE